MCHEYLPNLHLDSPIVNILAHLLPLPVLHTHTHTHTHIACTFLFILFICFKFFPAMLYGLWDLSSLTRNRTWVLAVKALTTGLPGIPQHVHLKKIIGKFSMHLLKIRTFTFITTFITLKVVICSNFPNCSSKVFYK